MSLKQTSAAILLAALLSTPALAACPVPSGAEGTPEYIAQQRERLVCLQNEIARTSAERKRDLEIDTINRSLDRIELQRRFDRLDFTPPEL